MNRVTIRQLLYECSQPMSPDNYAKMQKILDTEITPRKMMDMMIEQSDRIIGDAEQQIAYFHKDSDAFHAATVRRSCVEVLRAYAESLLRQFEEDDFSNTEKCSAEPLPFD